MVTPQPGDYIQLEGERHTEVGFCIRRTSDTTWLVRDTYDEDYVVVRNEDFDTNERRAWRAIR